MTKVAIPYWHKLFSLILLCSLSAGLSAQSNDSSKLNKKRLLIVAGGTTISYGTLFVGLNELWYKDYPRSSFHFINDSREWQQMDKLGHSFSSYYYGVAGIEMMKWTGMKKKQAIWIGGLYGTLLQTPIEILDGFSEKWGASAYDLAANSAGSALCISQALLWDEQRIFMKFSWTPSPYARHRPNTLGANYQEQFIKDYNAQTYWLSANLHSLLPKNNRWPEWLNMAVGYGSDGMLGGYTNVWTDDKGIQHDFTHIPRGVRQFYIGPDIDFTRIKSKNRFVRVFFYALNSLKFPLPALEYNTQSQLKWHWIKF